MLISETLRVRLVMSQGSMKLVVNYAVSICTYGYWGVHYLVCVECFALFTLPMMQC